ncbi:MAG: thioredoxin family protein [Halobacteriales archaeon]
MVEMDSEFELQPGDPVPDFELRGVDGDVHTPEDFADKDALLLVVTCNHCPYAQAKFELLNELAEEHDDVAVVGVNPNDADEYPDDSFEQMQAFVEEGRIDYDAYLRDEDQTVVAALGATCTPDPFLFRRNGGWKLAYHGRLDDALNPDEEPTRFHVREAFDAITAGEEVDLEWQPSRGCSIKWKPGNEPDYWD